MSQDPITNAAYAVHLDQTVTSDGPIIIQAHPLLNGIKASEIPRKLRTPCSKVLSKVPISTISDQKCSLVEDGGMTANEVLQLPIEIASRITQTEHLAWKGRTYSISSAR